VRSIAVVNQKGGCGKTTTVTSLAGCLAEEGQRVLVVDMDPQAHATIGLGIDPEAIDENLYEVLAEPDSAAALEEIVLESQPGLEVAPSGIILSALEQKLAAEGIAGRTERLALALDKLPDPYDFVLIDCPPNVGLLTFNALRAAREVIVPLETSFYAMHGVSKLLETISLLEDRIGHELRIKLLPTLFDGRTRFAKRALEEIRETYKDLVFDTVIRSNVRLRESAQRGVPISKLDKRCYADRAAGARRRAVDDGGREGCGLYVPRPGGERGSARGRLQQLGARQERRDAQGAERHLGEGRAARPGRLPVPLLRRRTVGARPEQSQARRRTGRRRQLRARHQLSESRLLPARRDP
jgi:chromosome partitioning protein